MGNNTTVELTWDDYKDILDVHIPKCDAIPTPINTHPNGFCFNVDAKWIWFTGKLVSSILIELLLFNSGIHSHILYYIIMILHKTNTVVRTLVAGDGEGRKHHIVEHFELPTLGAVPIYVALGPDNNIWVCF